MKKNTKPCWCCSCSSCRSAFSCQVLPPLLLLHSLTRHFTNRTITGAGDIAGLVFNFFGLLLFVLSTMSGCCNSGSSYREQQHGRKYLTSRTHNTAAAAATDLLQLFHYETRRRRSSDSGNHTANATATGKCAEWMNA
jgi:hypothetical protein